MRGISGRLGNYQLRDLIPFGTRRAAASRQRPWRLLWAELFRRSAVRSAADADPSVPDCRTLDAHVLDYRKLESLLLVSGEIYADH